MNDQFDELARGLVKSVTRRGALKQFGLGLAGLALAALGLVNKAEAAPKHCLPPYTYCKSPNYCSHHCCSGAGMDIGLDKAEWVCA